MELDDAIHTAILTLKEGFEGEISSKNIEIGEIGADKVFRVLTPVTLLKSSKLSVGRATNQDLNPKYYLLFLLAGCTNLLVRLLLL
ncbi:unnamed protein product [Brassica oleracea]